MRPATAIAATGEPHLPPFAREFYAPRYWTTWLGLALLRAGLYVPRPLWGFVGARLGDIYYALNAKRRRIARINIDLCFPELDAEARARLVRAHFRVAMQCALDIGWLFWASERRLARFVRIEGREHYQRAFEQGRKVILLTCHGTALEIGATIAKHYPLVGLVKPIPNKLVDWFLARGRLRYGGRLHARQQGLRPVVRSVREGAGFYYLPDEDLGLKDAAFVPFFGVPAATLTTLGRLAAMLDAVVIPYFPRRRDDGRGYDLVLKPPLADFPSGDPVADATRMNQALEAGIREAPAQYLWTFKRFKNRPPGERSPYA